MWTHCHRTDCEVAAEIGNGGDGLPCVSRQPDAPGRTADEKAIAVSWVEDNGANASADVSWAEKSPIALTNAGGLGYSIAAICGKLFTLNFCLQFLRAVWTVAIVVCIPTTDIFFGWSAESLAIRILQRISMRQHDPVAFIP